MVDLTAENLICMANESVDIALGLGREVLVIGFSAGGTIASWVAQHRSDVSKIVGISPFFAPFKMPWQAVEGARRALLRMPNVVVQWNPLANVIDGQIDYPFALPETHALAQIMLLGEQVHAAARDGTPGAAHIGVLLNPADRSVSNDATRAVIQQWKAITRRGVGQSRGQRRGPQLPSRLEAARTDPVSAASLPVQKCQKAAVARRAAFVSIRGDGGRMMKFLLTSAGVSNPSINAALVELLGKPIP